MRDLPIQTIFESLSAVRWQVAYRIYGNSHASLIGLLVDWWISLSPDCHTALDGAPSHGKGNAGQADAVFCRHEEAVGVLEAEGTVPLEKVKSIVKYFETARPKLKSIRFGVLVLYPTAPKGRGKSRQYRKPDESVFDEVKKATLARHGRAIIAIELEKIFERSQRGVRAISEYYSGTLSKVTGVLFTQGKEDGRLVLFESPPRAGGSPPEVR